MARVSRFSSSQRRDAVERAFGEDSTPTAVARELGVHPATLYRWASDPPATQTASSDVRLLRAAQDLLREADYAEVTVEQVAAASGVSIRTAFHRFESKRDLFHAAIDDAAGAVVEEMVRRGELTPQPDDPIDQLRLFLRVAAEAAYAVPQAHVLFRDVGVPPGDNVAQPWHERFESTLELLLREASAAGALRDRLNPEPTARMLSRAMRGIHAAVFDGVDPADAIALVDRLHLAVAARPSVD